MAMNTNTSETVGSARKAFEKELEDTRKNLKAKMRSLGIENGKTEKVRIPRINGDPDDVITCSINGVAFYFARGEVYDMPVELVELLTNTGTL